MGKRGEMGPQLDLRRRARPVPRRVWVRVAPLPQRTLGQQASVARPSFRPSGVQQGRMGCARPQWREGLIGGRESGKSKALGWTQGAERSRDRCKARLPLPSLGPRSLGPGVGGHGVAPQHAFPMHPSLDPQKPACSRDRHAHSGRPPAGFAGGCSARPSPGSGPGPAHHPARPGPARLPGLGRRLGLL